jgi:phosphoglycolate phosphatase
MTNQEFKNYLKEKEKKHIIFDFDETLCTLLIDWEPWRKDFQKLFFSYGDKAEEKGFALMQNKYIEKYGEEMREKILDINYQNEKKFYNGYAPHKEILSFLPELHDLFQLYIWTSNDKRTVMPIFSSLKIEKFFKKIITRNDVKFIKPEPDGFFLINENKYPKSEYLLIGDSESDSSAAESAGIDFINIAELK